MEHGAWTTIYRLQSYFKFPFDVKILCFTEYPEKCVIKDIDLSEFQIHVLKC